MSSGGMVQVRKIDRNLLASYGVHSAYGLGGVLDGWWTCAEARDIAAECKLYGIDSGLCQQILVCCEHTKFDQINESRAAQVMSIFKLASSELFVGAALRAWVDATYTCPDCKVKKL